MVESSALLKRRSSKGYRGFESLPHRHRSSDLRFSILNLASLRLLTGALTHDREPLRYLGRMGVIEHVISHVSRADS